MEIRPFTLSNGVIIPGIALGTWQMNEEQAYQATLIALKNGYRHIDTAYAYHNEAAIGKAIKDSGLRREDVFITSKLPAEVKDANEVRTYFESSLEALQTSYLDLYLIHAPWPWTEQGKDCMKENVEVFRVFHELYQEKKIRSIGVSNFHPEEIEMLTRECGIKPMVNQIRFFVGNTQKATYDYCIKNDILVEAYSPLGTGSVLDNEILKEMAKRYDTTVPKLCIAFCLQMNTLPLPKSTHEERIISNLDIPFTIKGEDMDILTSLNAIGSVRPYRS